MHSAIAKSKGVSISQEEIFEHFNKSFQAKNFYLKSFESDKHEINKKILKKILNEK